MYGYRPSEVLRGPAFTTHPHGSSVITVNGREIDDYFVPRP